jgi:hypothetical protein
MGIPGSPAAGGPATYSGMTQESSLLVAINQFMTVILSQAASGPEGPTSRRELAPTSRLCPTLYYCNYMTMVRPKVCSIRVEIKPQRSPRVQRKMYYVLGTDTSNLSHLCIIQDTLPASGLCLMVTIQTTFLRAASTPYPRLYLTSTATWVRLGAASNANFPQWGFAVPLPRKKRYNINYLSLMRKRP